MKKFLLILFIAVSCCCYSQKRAYPLTREVPANYYYNVDSAYKNILNSQLKPLNDKEKSDYAESMAYFHEALLSTGYVYFNWPQVEDYLNRLVDKIKQANKINKNFKVFVVRKEEVNASAMDNGFIYVNIGLLADTWDEGALVAILGHEISHAVNADMKTSYLLAKSKQEVTVKDLLKQSHGSRVFEARADKEGFTAATTLGYDISSAYHSFIKFETEFRWIKTQYSYQDAKWLIALDRIDKDKDVQADSLDFFLSSHPDNFARISALDKFRNSKNGNKAFIENETTFKAIQAKARIEQLYLDFQEANYKDCLKNAFYYHLSDHSNADYLYYITESLRRIILANPRIRKKGFLTDDSKEKVFEKNKGVLSDVSFITLDTILQKKIKTDSIYGNAVKPFNTYIQAYNFFIKKALSSKTPGSYLTAGLFELTKSNKEKSQEYFRAIDPLHDSATSALLIALEANLKENKKNIVYVESPEYYVREKGNLKYSFKETDKISPTNNSFFSKEFGNSEDSKRTLFLADSLSIAEYWNIERITANLHAFKDKQEIENENAENKVYDQTYWISKEAADPNSPEVLTRKKNFAYFSPEHWLWFKNNNVQSFTHIKPYYYHHSLLGTCFYFEISYFDPVNNKYCYSEQEYMQKCTNDNMRRVIKAFEKRKKETLDVKAN